MSRPVAALLALAALAPAPALAQVFPGAAAVTLVAPRLQAAPALLQQPLPAAETAPPTPPDAATPPAAPVRLNLSRPGLSLDASPPVEIRAKAAWSDDTGFGLRGTRLAYKARF